MLLTRLLNACHHIPGFVYEGARLREATRSIEIHEYGGPLITRHLSEDAQSSFDATCKKHYRFLCPSQIASNYPQIPTTIRFFQVVGADHYVTEKLLPSALGK